MSPSHVHDRYAEPTPFWREVRILQDDREFLAAIVKPPAGSTGVPVVFITSQDDRLRGLKGGVVFDATPAIAAERIVSRTHRLSTPEEIEAYKAARAKENQRCAQQELARKNTTVVTPSPESNEQLASVVAAAVQTALQNQPGGRQKKE